MINNRNLLKLKGALILLCIAVGCGQITTNEDFKTFLKVFNSDSIFQVNRIVFPLHITANDDDYNSVKQTIEKEDYSIIHINLSDETEHRSTDAFTQKILIEGEHATIQIRGIDNGIYQDIFFELRGGKWYLVSWDDSST